MARRGKSRNVGVRQARKGTFGSVQAGCGRLGESELGVVWQGLAGMARHGKARRGGAGKARHGSCWTGWFRLGMARQATFKRR